MKKFWFQEFVRMLKRLNRVHKNNESFAVKACCYDEMYGYLKSALYCDFIDQNFYRRAFILIDKVRGVSDGN